MRKPESKKKRIASAKRGLKRTLRLKSSRKKVAAKRAEVQDRKKAQDRKIAGLVDQYLKAKAAK
jgi:hypothetical protein